MPSSAGVSSDELGPFRAELARDGLLIPRGCAMNAFEFNDAAPRVLIVDDDPYIVRSLAERCRRMGFDVEPSASGRSALIKLGQCKLNLLTSELEGRWPQLLDSHRSSLHVVVIRGQSDLKAADCVEKVETSHILKGRNFWSKFDAILTDVFPMRKKDVVKKPAEKIIVIKRPRVLLVDDDMDVRKFIFSGLRKLGIEPSFAADGILGFWKAKRRPPAVIVSDYFMPNSDAESLLARLRSTPETQDIPFIVQSGRQLSDVIIRRLQGEVCGQKGASLILKKSLGARELLGNLQIMCGLSKSTPTELLNQ